MANRLANETSPYLLQHAHNPVDWYPWGAEAIERARREDKPILLSVGYSACHWCHVMERESFESDDTARVMNENFVNVKVDREERPDVDSIYMQAVQAMTGHGGWPMTVFLTPDLAPFWGGTYFPPEDRHGMPSFRRVLAEVVDAYRNRGDDVRRVASSMREMYASGSAGTRSSGAVVPELLERARRALMESYDATHGGFGDAPKFPQAMAMEFLLQQWARTGDRDALDAPSQTFLRMARGGIYDQIGGGFARYSVDARWLVPHFEKMLYDNALLLRVGVHLWQATENAEIRRVCGETLDWLAREMTSPEGAFYATIDADSEGREGKFYLWTTDELRSVLGGDAGQLIAYWGATAAGNFEAEVEGEGEGEGGNILHVADATAPRPSALSDARERLYEARAKRVWPARDEKVLASWNGLMLRSVAEAARAFGAERDRALAVRNAEFLFGAMVRDGRVFRTHKDGRSRIQGFLEDHSAVALGALSVYELTFDRTWLDRARALADSVVEWFWDDGAKAFFDTPSDHEELITRPRDVTDNATPSGTSLTVELLLRLGNIFGDADMLRRANYVLETVAEPMARYPLAFGHALTAADMAVRGSVDVALVGNPDDAGFKALASVAGAHYAPSLVLVGGTPEHGADIAVLAEKSMLDGRPTAYVCRHFTCTPPITKRADLRNAIASSQGPFLSADDPHRQGERR